ncbi:Metallo-beta-lactamase superfamily protein [Pseudomonas sp. UC 17F4]|nr:Metallo-beta-lactamase superfamily protein [Pseudomonas sp. UC 17F4]
MFRVRAIQVEHGDALLVSYGTAEHPRHLLVDGGPSESSKTLLSVLEKACVDGILKLEALVVTHYDLDHIQGVIELLEKLPPWLQIEDVWFNGYHHLGASDALGAKEGDALSALIRNLGLPWNKYFKKGGADNVGRAVMQNSDAVNLPGGLEIRVLSPDQSGLSALNRVWKNPAIPPPEPEDMPRDVLGRDDSWPPGEFSATRVHLFTSDRSVSNQSSIALHITFDSKHVLLAGDAFADVVTAGLQLNGPSVENFDLLKVSHHGSKGNTHMNLLALIGCKRFLISTNGKSHKHPDHELIERLVANGRSPEIIFNYDTGWSGKWKQRPAGWPFYSTHYPKHGDHFVEVLI